MNNIIVHKLSVADIGKELLSCSLHYDFICLSKTQKWCTELLYSIDSSCLETILNDNDSLKIDLAQLVGVNNFMKFQLARCYFNLKEYARASFYLQDQWSDCSDDLTSSGAHSVCYFLYIYAKYMSIMKKYADNRADLLNNVDLNYLDNLQSLRAELSTKYNKNQLDAYSLYVYGVVLSKLKLNDEAISVLIESIKKRPNLWCSWLELTNLIKSIEILNTLNHSTLPQHWMKDLFLAHCYMELSLSEEALNIYNLYASKGFAKSIYIKSQIAKCFDNLREGQQCKLTFENLRHLDPYNLDYMDIYSNILFVLEDYVQLAILAQDACEIDKYKPESCCIIGNYYSLQNEHHKAVNYFQRALKLNPNYLQAWILMGHEFIELKNSTSAIQSYTNAIELNAKDYRAWYGLGQTYEILKLYSYSLYYYKQAYLLRPNDSRFIVALGDVYVKLEKLDEAKRCYIKAYSVGDYEGIALCKLAKVYEKLNEPINVAIAYDQFTEDQKLLKRTNQGTLNELSQAYKYLANFYLKKMKLDNAYEAASKCLEFPETRQEAQSILNQIAQARNAIKDQSVSQSNPSVVIVPPSASSNAASTSVATITGDGMDTSNPDPANIGITPINQEAELNQLQQQTPASNVGSTQDKSSSSKLTHDNLTEDEDINDKNLDQMQQGQSSGVNPTTGSSGAGSNATGGSDSESDQFFSNFNIKRFSKRE